MTRGTVIALEGCKMLQSENTRDNIELLRAVLVHAEHVV